jgi:hypothetical protein
MKTIKTVHYCKADKKTGKPVVITDMKDKSTKNVKSWSMDLYDENDVPVRIEVVFGNATGKAKASGATTVLKVMR